MTMMDKTLGHGVKSDEALEAMAKVLFRPMGADGVYARTALYEDIVERLAALISRHREPDTEILRFPPVTSRHVVEKSGYLKSFPNLLGCVCSLHGSEREIRAAADKHEHGGDWTETLKPAELVLAPAACYPVYPLVAERGPVARGGVKFDVACDCFRREPSKHLDRLQSFRMREYVCIGTPEEITDFRTRWVARAQQLADTLGLVQSVAPASDPFFGRTGQIMAISQLQNSLKFELLVPVRSNEEPTACMSFNYHQEHFGEIWDIKTETGIVAHTGCVAFGMDRLAVAMFAQHGIDTAAWPEGVRKALMLG
jgi:seryl-tRNA synthetase